jgi:hypothetical protein
VLARGYCRGLGVDHGHAAAVARRGIGGQQDLLLPGAASAASKTVEYTFHNPLFIADNLCNGDVVGLSGDFYVRVTTTPTRNGGYRVVSSVNGRDLQGETLAPQPPRRYRGDDSENTYSYVAPPPYPATYSVTHWTRLVPEGDAPTMYLVIVLRETIAADGTPVVPTLERTYLKCKPPKGSSKRHDDDSDSDG